MNYLLMIHADEAEWTQHDAAQQADVMTAHERLQEELTKAGKYRGCGGLAPVSSATTLRYQDGQRVITDGPYAETREQFGGYYVVDASDLDDAIAIAERIPVTARASVEIRPIQDLRLP